MQQQNRLALPFLSHEDLVAIDDDSPPCCFVLFDQSWLSHRRPRTFRRA
jgi:hypothetical protein